MVWEQLNQLVERLEGNHNDLDINFEVADAIALLLTMFDDDDEGLWMFGGYRPCSQYYF